MVPSPLSRPLWSLRPRCTPSSDTPCAVSPIDPPYYAVGPAPARRRGGCSRGDSESGVRIALALLDREIQHLLEYRSHQADSEAPTPTRGGTREARGTEKITALHLTTLVSQHTKTGRRTCSREGGQADNHRRRHHAGRVQRCAWALTRA